MARSELAFELLMSPQCNYAALWESCDMPALHEKYAFLILAVR